MEIEEVERLASWEERNEGIPYMTHIIAGSIAGFTEHSFMLPMDSVKTHLQASRSPHHILTTIRSIFNYQGFRGFWQGISAVALGCIPAHAAYFSIYEIARDKLNLNDGKINTLLFSLTGGLATIFHDAIYTPFDVIKQRQQLLLNREMNTLRMLKKLVAEEGSMSLFRSLPVTVGMNIPNAAILVGVNDTLKVLLKPKEGHTFPTYFMCAAIAGACAATLTIPLDVIKTKLQTQNACLEAPGCCNVNPAGFSKASTSSTTTFTDVSSKSPSLVDQFKRHKTTLVSNMKLEVNTNLNNLAADCKKIKYQNVRSTIKTIFAEEGFRGFFRGIVPRILTQSPAAAISWTTYECMKQVLGATAKHH